MSRFESIVNRLPVSWESLVAQGVNYLSEELEAEEVKLTVHNNGVSIGIITDEENKKEAIEFWKEHVQPALNGEE